jgi:hypothetical protein
MVNERAHIDLLMTELAAEVRKARLDFDNQLPSYALFRLVAVAVAAWSTAHAVAMHAELEFPPHPATMTRTPQGKYTA